MSLELEQLRQQLRQLRQLRQQQLEQEQHLRQHELRLQQQELELEQLRQLRQQQFEQEQHLRQQEQLRLGKLPWPGLEQLELAEAPAPWMRMIADVQIPPRPPPLDFDSFHEGWRQEGDPFVRWMVPAVDMEVLRAGCFIIKSAILRPAQAWQMDDVVICKIDLLVHSEANPAEGYFGHLTLGYGSSRDDGPNTWVAWMQHRTSKEYQNLKQIIRQTCQGRSLQQFGLLQDAAHLDKDGKRVLMDWHDDDRGMMLGLLKGVRKELKLGQTSLFRPHNLLDKNRSWHVSFDGVAKMCVFV